MRVRAPVYTCARAYTLQSPRENEGKSALLRGAGRRRKRKRGGRVRLVLLLLLLLRYNSVGLRIASECVYNIHAWAFTNVYFYIARRGVHSPIRNIFPV